MKTLAQESSYITDGENVHVLHLMRVSYKMVKHNTAAAFTFLIEPRFLVVINSNNNKKKKRKQVTVRVSLSI